MNSAAAQIVDVTGRIDGRIDEELRGIDALCARWATEAWDWPSPQKSPIYRGMREREGAAAPGSPPQISDESMLLDRVLAHSDRRYYALVTVWYVYTGSVTVKAKRLHTNRTDLYHRWRRTLEYLKGRLHGLGLTI